MNKQPTHDSIMQTGMGLVASKTLMPAVALEFTVLGHRSMTSAAIAYKD